jgi:hypothetical protein
MSSDVVADTGGGAMVGLPALTLEEVRLLYAVNLLRSLTRHAGSYDEHVDGLRHTILDVRTAVLHRFPPQSPDGLYRLPAVTVGELRYLRLALANLHDGLGHLSAFGDLGGSQLAPAALLQRITQVAGAHPAAQ